MKTSRFTDSQIIAILKQVEGGSATIGLACQAFGISQTCYRYRAKLDAD